MSDSGANRLRPETNQAFLAAVQKSRLLTDEQLGLLSDAENDASSLSATVRELLQLEWLTPWQIKQLRSGRTEFRLGNYTLLDVVGRGKMGIVYKARRAKTQQIVAIKLMASEIARDGRKSARFRREIRLVSAVQSPHVVLALDAGHIADRDFLVTEFIPGWNLLQWVDRQHHLPVDWVCECVRQAAIGLQHIHERGLIHRDLKPSNLMVTADSVQAIPHARILDLGLGRFVAGIDEGGDLTSAGHTVGTLDYMAPEQIQSGRDADIRADIYSLGCTLFQSLSGRLPFEGTDVGTKLIAKFTTEPPLLDTCRNDVPHKLAEVVAQMMSRERNQRLPVPKDVAEALRPFSIVPRSHAKLSAEAAAVVPDFFECVESMREGHLNRWRQRQRASSTQRCASWLRQVCASLQVDGLLSKWTRRRRRQHSFQPGKSYRTQLPDPSSMVQRASRDRNGNENEVF
jgi:serine/threonine-protein kinase